MHILKRQRHTELRGSLSLQRDDAADGLGKVTGVVSALVSMASPTKAEFYFEIGFHSDAQAGLELASLFLCSVFQWLDTCPSPDPCRPYRR